MTDMVMVIVMIMESVLTQHGCGIACVKGGVRGYGVSDPSRGPPASVSADLVVLRP